MANNYISCSSCGMTYLETADRRCPHCGTAEERSAGGFSLSDMRFGSDRLQLKSIIVLLIAVLALALLNFAFSIRLNSQFAESREDYEAAKAIVESGQYAEVIREYNEMKDRIDSGYKYTDDQMAEFEELEAVIRQLPDDIYGAMAETEGLFDYIDLLVVVNVITGVAYIIAAVLVLLRFRLSFRVMLGALALGIAGLVIFDLWGVIMGYRSFSLPRIMCYVTCCVPIIKECIGCDALVYSAAAAKPASAAVVGAAMPKVQELYSFEDMPELSGMKGLEEAQPLEQQDAQDEDDVMDSVDPIGVANTTAEKPRFQPTEVAPEVEPVVPLMNYRAGGSITDEGENVAITPLERPMFSMDMMDDEAMPAIGGEEEQSVPQPEPVQNTVSATGIWFCSVCGSLNENITVCDTCGANKQ